MPFFVYLCVSVCVDHHQLLYQCFVSYIESSLTSWVKFILGILFFCSYGNNDCFLDFFSRVCYWCIKNYKFLYIDFACCNFTEFICPFFIIYLFGGTGVWTQGNVLARHALYYFYYLSSGSSPSLLFSYFFPERACFCLGWLWTVILFSLPPK
jgi:hypothetical protein